MTSQGFFFNALGDEGGTGVVDVSGMDFPSRRFEVEESESEVVVPFICPFDSCCTSE